MAENKQFESSEQLDTISRTAVLDEIHKYMEARDYTIGTLYDNICEMPSAQQWIPVTDRLPDTEDEVLTILDSGEFYVQAYTDGEWYYDDVVAWMPLPEPYRKE